MRIARDAAPSLSANAPEHTSAAAAPSLTGLHIGSVSGQTIGRAARTSSTVKLRRYWERGLWTECAWFLALTAAIWRWVVPNRAM